MSTLPNPQVPLVTASDEGDLRLPKPPGFIRRFWADHPRLTDWLITLFWTVPVLGVTLAGTDARAAPGGQLAQTLFAVPCLVAASIGFFVRRTRPVLALALLALALLPAPLTDGSPTQLLPVFGVYALAVYRSNAAGWIGAGALELASVLYAWLTAPLSSLNSSMHIPASWAVLFGVELLVGLLIGVTIGNRRRYLAALIDRAAQLARERDQHAMLATAAERSRIAREMHDVVSHSLTVMVTLAEGSAALADAAPQRAAAAMRQVADTGRDALTDMRRMLGVLGGDAGELAPQPGSAELPVLIERFRDLGLPVVFRAHGELARDATVQLTVYRIVQECLTNALRYAHGPTRVDVRIDADGDPLVITVEDDGLAGIPTPSQGAGRGLLGLGERLAVVGGALTAGPRAEGAGWRVSAVLPDGGAATAATPPAADPDPEEHR